MNALMQVVASLDTSTWFCLVVMAAFGAWLISTQTGSGLLTLYYFPALIVGSLAFQQLLAHFNVALVADKAVNTMAVVCLGSMISLPLAFLLSRVVTGIRAALITPPPPGARVQQSAVSRRL